MLNIFLNNLERKNNVCGYLYIYIILRLVNTFILNCPPSPFPVSNDLYTSAWQITENVRAGVTVNMSQPK